MSAKSALIFGHSHVWSIKRAIASKAYEPKTKGFVSEVILCGTREFPGPLITRGLNGHLALNACLIAELNKRASGAEKHENEWLVSVVQGNFYNIIGLFQANGPFDFVVPGAESLPLDAKAALVPYGAIRALIEDQASEMKQFLTYLTKLGHKHVAHINAPPPIESESFIIEDLTEKKAFEGESAELTSASTRLKLWMTQKAVVEAMCGELGITCFNAPASTLDELGFLKKEYWKDAVHANEHYSAMVLKDLERVVMEGVAA